MGAVDFLDSRVRVQHPCPFCDLSKGFPEVEFAHWCNRSSDVVHIAIPDPAIFPRLLDVLHDTLDLRDVYWDGQAALTMTRKCACDSMNSIVRIAEDSDCWPIPPVTYYGGWETHRILATRPESLRRFVAEVKRVGKIEIISHRPRRELGVVRDLAILPVHLFEGLTDRQVHALVSAHENGLLEIPARRRMDHVARDEGLSRSTYGEHLRKGLWQVLKNAYPFLKLRDLAGEGGRAGADEGDQGEGALSSWPSGST
jgi:predicted DNA binding protein